VNENQADKIIIRWKIINCVQSLSVSLLVFVVGVNTAQENTKINELLNLRKELRAFKNVQLNMLLSMSQFHDYENF